MANTVLWIWFALTTLSVAYVAYDLFTSTPEMKVMKWGWILVTVYTGPVALVIYWRSCREPATGTHETFIAPLWKQSVGSTIHCLAGDASGIIVAAAVTSVLRSPMGIDAAVEYVAGFAVGLLIFQALFMKDMLGVSYRKAVAKTWLPEWLSMNAVMAGMVPTMVIVMTRDTSAMDPTGVRFWGVMSLATLVGAATGFPVNWWLVKHGLKHGMGTERVLGKGGVDAPSRSVSTHGEAMPGMGMSDKPMPMSEGQTHEKQPQVSRATKLVAAVLTLLLLAGGVVVAGRYGQLTMRAGESMPAMPMKMRAGSM
jgi:hypothetical protein